jgi:hypothetical protein
VVLAGIFGEGEQLTAMTCNYKRLAERNSQTQGSDGPVGCQGWLSLDNKLTTYLLGVQEAAMKESEI